MSEKKKKKSDYNKDDAIRDVGPIYTDSKGNKSQIPSQEMFDKMHPSDRTVIESEINNVDQLGNVISANPTYTMGGLTEQPHLGYIPRTKGGSILSKGNISKGKNGVNTVIKKFGHEGAIDPKKAQITKLLNKGGSILSRGNKLAKHKLTKLY